MAKRGRDDRDYYGERPHSYSNPRDSGSSSSRPWESRTNNSPARDGYPPHKKSRPPPAPGPKQPTTGKVENVVRGSPVLSASLLIQLLADLRKDPIAQDELRAITGPDVLADVSRLQRTLEPHEAKIKEQLHREPKLPDGTPPMAYFPSKLSATITSDRVAAHWRTVPPLPKIKDAQLADLPFAHRSVFGNDHRKAVIASYERLELLGDAYIEAIATRLLYPLYPDLAAGRLSHLREKLVCNETLAAFSMAYNFAEDVRVPDTYLEEGANRSKIWTKMLGDVFEAYLAAVVIGDPDHGFEIAEKWLCTLWAPLLPDAEFLKEPEKSAKQDLQKKLGGVGVKLEYEQQGELIPFRGGQYWNVAVFLTGWGFTHELLGKYRGRSKQVAELGAAEEAFVNPLTGQIQAIKLKYDEKVRQDRARAAEELEQSRADA